VTDKIKKDEVKIEFCLIHNMLADFFTKPLQGALFVRMRQIIMNWPSGTSTTVHRSVLDKQNYGTNKGSNNEAK